MLLAGNSQPQTGRVGSGVPGAKGPLPCLGPITCPGQPSLPSRTLCWIATLSWPHSRSHLQTPRTYAPQSSTGQHLSSRLTGEGSHGPTPFLTSVHPGLSLLFPALIPPLSTHTDTSCKAPALQCSQLPAPQAQPSWSAVLRDPSHLGRCPQGQASFLFWLRPPH